MPLPLRQHIRLWYGLQLLSVSLLLYISPIPGLTCWRGFCFLPGVIFLRYTIALLRLNYALKYRHSFPHALLQPMELESFVDLVSQDLIVVLSDVI